MFVWFCAKELKAKLSHFSRWSDFHGHLEIFWSLALLYPANPMLHEWGENVIQLWICGLTKFRGAKRLSICAFACGTNTISCHGETGTSFASGDASSPRDDSEIWWQLGNLIISRETLISDRCLSLGRGTAPALRLPLKLVLSPMLSIWFLSNSASGMLATRSVLWGLFFARDSQTQALGAFKRLTALSRRSETIPWEGSAGIAIRIKRIKCRHTPGRLCFLCFLNAAQRPCGTSHPEVSKRWNWRTDSTLAREVCLEPSTSLGRQIHIAKTLKMFLVCERTILHLWVKNQLWNPEIRQTICRKQLGGFNCHLQQK